MLEGQLAEVLAEEDVIKFADVMLPGTAAGVLVWENLWAAPFAVTARKMGAQMIASDRIHTQALIASMQGERRRRRPTSQRAKETDMPLGPGRIGRPGAVGRPVARTAAVVGGAAVVAHGVNRRQDRRDDRRDRRGPG